MSETLPPCILCGKTLTASGETFDMVCAGRPGEPLETCCTLRLQRWMETSAFAEVLKQNREAGLEDWQTSLWRVAIDYWLDRGGFPPLRAGESDPILEAA